MKNTIPTGLFKIVGQLDPPDLTSFLYQATGSKVPTISVRSHLDPPLTKEVFTTLARPHRSSHYFLIFVQSGTVEYSVDLRQINVSAGQFLFVRPHQVRVPPLNKNPSRYFKIIFDGAVLSLLPKNYQFWLDPLGEPVVDLSATTAYRLARSMEILRETLNVQGGFSLSIAYLNAIMAELEASYFSGVIPGASAEKMRQFLGFQAIVEQQFVRHPLVSEIAKDMGIGETSLYSVVKKMAGVSPKMYLDNRIVLEAKRLLVYSGNSAKELAISLGFSDENYFSRFFRRHTGHSITEFRVEFEDLSRRIPDSSLSSVNQT